MRPLEITFSRPQQSRIMGWSGGRKWVQSEMEILETTLLDLTQVAFWAGQEEKRVPSARRPFETLFSRPYQSWILCLSSGRKWFLSANQPHDRRIIDFKKVAFSVDQEAENVFKVHSKTWNIALSTSSKSRFGVIKRQNLSSHYLATTRQVAFFISSKSHFRLVQMPKIIWKSIMSPLNIEFSTSTNSHFAMFK